MGVISRRRGVDSRALFAREVKSRADLSLWLRSKRTLITLEINKSLVLDHGAMQRDTGRERKGRCRFENQIVFGSVVPYPWLARLRSCSLGSLLIRWNRYYISLYFLRLLGLHCSQSRGRDYRFQKRSDASLNWLSRDSRKHRRDWWLVLSLNLLHMHSRSHWLVLGRSRRALVLGERTHFQHRRLRTMMHRR